MSIDRDDNIEGIRTGVGKLRACAAAEETRAESRLRAAVAQLGQPDELWIDDRLRAEITNSLSGMIGAIEVELRARAGRSLAMRGGTELADLVIAPATGVENTLLGAGLLTAPDLVHELVARVMQDLIGEALPPVAPIDSDGPSLMVRLATAPDGTVASLATTYMTASARRRGPREGNGPARTDLPAELHHRLVWWTAAAIAAGLPAVENGGQVAVDRALTDAALRSLAGHDEGDRVEAVAMQLAAAIEATPEELPGLVAEALQDRHLPLFIALLAHAVGVDFDSMREIVLDPAAERLWLVARSLDLPREVIARIGLSLCEADPRRDLDAFADRIDSIAAINAEDARLALAPLRRHPEFRAAARALARGVAA